MNAEKQKQLEKAGWKFGNAPSDIIVFVRGMLRSGFITEAFIQSVVGELKPSDSDIVLKRLPLCR